MKLFLSLALGLLLTAPPALAATTTWQIDNDHTLAQFKVQHLVITHVRGSFSKIQGTVVIDEQDPTKSTVDVTIDARSINTNVEKRDAHLKSPDFLDVEKFPTITFKSKAIKQGAGGRLNMLGDLTIHGVTKEVELLVTGPTATITDPWGNQRKGAQATTRINRKDFGLTWNKMMETGGVVVGDDVEISIETELIKQPG